jgi:predicted DNA-binding transcriptional regulator YafY
MRKADRLFEIIQILRRSKQPITADQMAAELETSKRSVYRDIAALLAQRVPIRGEAGIGYVLDKGLDMPPLMLTTDEIEAAVLGAQWVINRGDPQLSKAAQDLLAKIEASIPERLRPYIDDPAHRVVPAWDRAKDAIDLGMVRNAINAIVLEERFPERPSSLRVKWRKAMEAEWKRRKAEMDMQAACDSQSRTRTGSTSTAT